MQWIRKTFAGRDGCGYLITTCFFTCLFLLINGRLAFLAYRWLAPSGPHFVQQPRFAQFVLFLAPVLMLVIEWYVADRVVQQLSRHND